MFSAHSLLTVSASLPFLLLLQAAPGTAQVPSIGNPLTYPPCATAYAKFSSCDQQVLHGTSYGPAEVSALSSCLCGAAGSGFDAVIDACASHIDSAQGVSLPAQLPAYCNGRGGLPTFPAGGGPGPVNTAGAAGATTTASGAAASQGATVRMTRRCHDAGKLMYTSRLALRP